MSSDLRALKHRVVFKLRSALGPSCRGPKCFKLKDSFWTRGGKKSACTAEGWLRPRTLGDSLKTFWRALVQVSVWFVQPICCLLVLPGVKSNGVTLGKNQKSKISEAEHIREEMLLSCVASSCYFPGEHLLCLTNWRLGRCVAAKGCNWRAM